jgi:hypothetical protein
VTAARLPSPTGAVEIVAGRVKAASKGRVQKQPF